MTTVMTEYNISSELKKEQQQADANEEEVFCKNPPYQSPKSVAEEEMLIEYMDDDDDELLVTDASKTTAVVSELVVYDDAEEGFAANEDVQQDEEAVLDESKSAEGLNNLEGKLSSDFFDNETTYLSEVGEPSQVNIVFGNCEEEDLEKVVDVMTNNTEAEENFCLVDAEKMNETTDFGENGDLNNLEETNIDMMQEVESEALKISESIVDVLVDNIPAFNENVKEEQSNTEIVEKNDENVSSEEFIENTSTAQNVDVLEDKEEYLEFYTEGDSKVGEDDKLIGEIEVKNSLKQENIDNFEDVNVVEQMDLVEQVDDSDDVSAQSFTNFDENKVESVDENLNSGDTSVQENDTYNPNSFEEIFDFSQFNSKYLAPVLLEFNGVKYHIFPKIENSEYNSAEESFNLPNHILSNINFTEKEEIKNLTSSESDINQLENFESIYLIDENFLDSEFYFEKLTNLFLGIKSLLQIENDLIIEFPQLQLSFHELYYTSNEVSLSELFGLFCDLEPVKSYNEPFKMLLSEAANSHIERLQFLRSLQCNSSIEDLENKSTTTHSFNDFIDQTEIFETSPDVEEVIDEAIDEAIEKSSHISSEMKSELAPEEDVSPTLNSTEDTGFSPEITKGDNEGSSIVAEISGVTEIDDTQSMSIVDSEEKLKRKADENLEGQAKFLKSD
ncbi:hypothetical protein HK099_004320 [Clydaea vesicula]|uniref:Uncharacterized protein n=1 Tax=Clydaea vesicula TaxID=447962 RepID=A0AAD5U6Y3_9FUNG|nr:hypothetical protein HK099_004320 [Clydaea vesicula]